jgi:hypothetical protein
MGVKNDLKMMGKCTVKIASGAKSARTPLSKAGTAFKSNGIP